ncbi:histidinol-phosphate transaminase [Lysobacter fragariae]
MNVLDLVREDLRDFGGYRSARSDSLDGSIWLNANESPWANRADPEGRLRRYPDPQPAALREALAAVYGCDPTQLLMGRGSDEGIDLLVRALCVPGGDAIVVTTPTFGMYAVSARLHGTRVIDVPLLDRADGYACDFDAVAQAARRGGAKIVFLCSPGNPGGNLLALEDIAALASRLRGTALVVVDEAYIEFAKSASAVALLATHPNVAVLRTLSKTHALAAARIGSVIAAPELISVLRRCQAPYPLPQASVDAAIAALSSQSLEQTNARVAVAISERERMCQALPELAGVRFVYPSSANFLLLRCTQAQIVFDALLAEGIVVRDLRAVSGLEDALRISIGTPNENDRVLTVLRRTVDCGVAA